MRVIFHGGGGNVYINAADGAVFMFDGVDGADAFENVIYGIVGRILAGFNGQAFVTHVLQSNDFPAHLFLGQLFAGEYVYFAHDRGSTHSR